MPIEMDFIINTNLPHEQDLFNFDLQKFAFLCLTLAIFLYLYTWSKLRDKRDSVVVELVLQPYTSSYSHANFLPKVIFIVILYKQ